MTRYMCGYVCWQDRDGATWVDRRQFLYGVPCTDMLTLYAQAQVEHVLRELYGLLAREDHHTDDDGAEEPWAEICVQDTWPDA